MIREWYFRCSNWKFLSSTSRVRRQRQIQILITWTSSKLKFYSNPARGCNRASNRVVHFSHGLLVLSQIWLVAVTSILGKRHWTLIYIIRWDTFALASASSSGPIKEWFISNPGGGCYIEHQAKVYFSFPAKSSCCHFYSGKAPVNADIYYSMG